MQSHKNKERERLHNRSTTNKTTKEQVKLPYLRLNPPMKPIQNIQQQNNSLNNTFDLHTNHAAIPRYQASKDSNLIYFFSKPSNQKIIEELKQLETATKRKHLNTQRQLNQSRSLHLAKEVRGVSKTEFDSYISKMKAKVVSPNMQI